MASISKYASRLAITPLFDMLSERIVNVPHRIIPIGRISHICGSTFLCSMISVISVDRGEEHMIEDTLTSKYPTGVVDMAVQEEAAQATEGTVKTTVKKVSPNILQTQLLISVKS